MKASNKYLMLAILIACVGMGGYFISLVFKTVNENNQSENISVDSIHAPKLLRDSIK